MCWDVFVLKLTAIWALMLFFNVAQYSSERVSYCVVVKSPYLLLQVFIHSNGQLCSLCCLFVLIFKMCLSVSLQQVLYIGSE